MKKSIILKKLLIFTLFCVIFAVYLTEFGFFSINNNIKNKKLNENFVQTNSQNETNFLTPEVEHLFTHCLLVNPQKALNRSNEMSIHYDRDCLTTSEFEIILQSLYDKNYVIVNANDCFKIDNNGKAEKVKFTLPNGKKPFILSIDDVNYDHRKMNMGMADKIAVDKNGRLCSIIDGKYDYEREFVSVLENFIYSHKDFSHNGAKAMLCLTGYDGILGYRTQTGNRQEIDDAKKVVKALKDNGYYFACHSYGHYHMKKVSNKTFDSEIALWKSEVEPLIDKTNIYVYPYGENEILSNDKISYKHQLLLDEGFKLFCGVGDKHFYSYFPFNTAKENQVLFMDRRPLDGFSLRAHKDEYQIFFDCMEVYDSKNRFIPI